MAKLTDKMKEVITGQQAWVATSGADGRASLAIKGSAKILDDEHLAFFELVGNRTWANIQKPLGGHSHGRLNQVQGLQV